MLTSVFLNHFISQSYCLILSFHPFIVYWSHFFSFPVNLPLPHFLSCFLWNINSWNLNICSANAGVRLLIWSLCWWRREAGGRDSLGERWKACRQPENALQTCLGVTNPSKGTLSAVSRSFWLIWSYCSNLGLFTERKKKTKIPNSESCTRRSLVVIRDTTTIRLDHADVSRCEKTTGHCSVL